MVKDLISLAEGIGLSGESISRKNYTSTAQYNKDNSDDSDDCDCHDGDCYCVDCSDCDE